MKRYEPCFSHAGKDRDGLFEHPQGRFVMHTDYAALQAKADRLAEALEVMAAHEVDYMTRNNFGDPEKQSYMVMARQALADYRKGE